MQPRSSLATAFFAALLLSASWARAQPASPPSGESRMGPASGNTGGASNGVGTAGSLDKDAGAASSTVTGVAGGSTGYKGSGSSGGGAGGPMESDPSQGGGKQTR